MQKIAFFMVPIKNIENGIPNQITVEVSKKLKKPSNWDSIKGTDYDYVEDIFSDSPGYEDGKIKLSLHKNNRAILQIPKTMSTFTSDFVSIAADEIGNLITDTGKYEIENSCCASSTVYIEDNITHGRRAEGVSADDYLYSFGVEFELGLPGIHANSKIVSGWCYDSGGVEVQTPVLDDLNLFDMYSKYDAFLKKVRTNSKFFPSTCISSHVHFSVNADKKPSFFGNGLRRRQLIRNNLFGLFVKYYIGLAFFDGFIPGGRRKTYYGQGLKFNTRKGVSSSDSRITDMWRASRRTTNYGLDRESLLRTTVDTGENDHIHYEYRGTDLCASSIFMGLKIELLKAILKKAVNYSLNDQQILRFDPKVLWEINKPNDLNFYELIDIRARKKAHTLVEDVAEFLPEYAYKGLKAWADYVDHIDEDTGTDSWYIKNELILVRKIGVDKFITTKDLINRYTRNNEEETFKLKQKRGRPGKFLMHKEVVSASSFNMLFGDEGCYTDNPGLEIAASCDNCGEYGYRAGLDLRKGVTLCNDCYNVLYEYKTIAKTVNYKFDTRVQKRARDIVFGIF